MLKCCKCFLYTLAGGCRNCCIGQWQYIAWPCLSQRLWK